MKPTGTWIAAFALVALFAYASSYVLNDEQAPKALADTAPVSSSTRPEVTAAPLAISTSSTPEGAPTPVTISRPDTPTEAENPRDANLPARLIIPSTGQNSPIEYLSTNTKGEMDVPSGKTNDVGWYKFGTIPGDIGSAVLDAHVFAAFNHLHNIKAGDDIYVETKSGEKIRFIVDSTETLPLAEISPDKLFNRNDARRLNLITCAGTFIPSKGTYDHRLIVYAVRAD